jgi:membrane-bound metal-dependent hydrolase YbcI (DUF457 family)
MFIGHFAPAFVAAAMPKAPRLGLLFIAAQLVDFGFFVLVMLGVEHMRIVPGITATNPMDLYHMPFTHSLIGSAVWALALAGVIWVMTKNRTGAAIGAMVVLSHWFLDVLVHRPDMTLLGTAPKLGLGLWNMPMIEMPLELGITCAALGYYLSRTRAIGNATLTPAWVLGGMLLVVQLYNWFAPEPKTYDISLPISALIAFTLFAWLAFRLDRTRMPKGAGET